MKRKSPYCNRCNGTGSVHDPKVRTGWKRPTKKCPKCDGTGYKWARESEGPSP
jgi:DnaJ-class molecular chaperone